MKKKITIGNIAEQLGVSKTTISFVLNGKAREKHISESLEEKILQHIEKVGYRPNQFAQGLRSGKTKIIGMLVEDISDPFFSSVARQIEEIAYKKGYKIIYSSTENETEKAKDLIEIYRSRQVDGYIIAPPPGLEKEINDLLDDNLPVVIFDRTIHDVDTNTVLVNNYASAYDAVAHFIEGGYKNIAMVTLSSDQEQMLERMEGYIDALKRIKGVPLIKKVIYHDRKETSVKEIQDFLVSNKQIDAVFFATNYIADSGLESIKNLNLNIPNDLGVIVFDDHQLYRLFSPPLTAVSQPIKAIAENSINIMLEILDGRRSLKDKKSVVLDNTLMVRGSSLKRN
ncbi:transcriptional regulator, LacI family [Pseudopedobacter saltans DSM 12145]|uniref:Transcriptional regulator, LacI family n=1 Tax=Pseudopedobacter saltans (strain ATCC 51119 / DSM 12145 / JCM 21818 / CCUG 39354 / LMG 10337 / NBRC 100064 / NCIMB 13643) TaxID=762903 RepID=F0S6G8_PSESL|nr:substrate-binding domain-containing protein [Pseudopedobacter saltans]ADY54294.1 transcriptional regulator, LacI family [Pseudopedobacter saltans DSM 12145]